MTFFLTRISPSAVDESYLNKIKPLTDQDQANNWPLMEPERKINKRQRETRRTRRTKKDLYDNQPDVTAINTRWDNENNLAYLEMW